MHGLGEKRRERGVTNHHIYHQYVIRTWRTVFAKQTYDEVFPGG